MYSEWFTRPQECFPVVVLRTSCGSRWRPGWTGCVALLLYGPLRVHPRRMRWSRLEQQSRNHLQGVWTLVPLTLVTWRSRQRGGWGRPPRLCWRHPVPAVYEVFHWSPCVDALSACSALSRTYRRHRFSLQPVAMSDSLVCRYILFHIIFVYSYYESHVDVDLNILRSIGASKYTPTERGQFRLHQLPLSPYFLCCHVAALATFLACYEVNPEYLQSVFLWFSCLLCLRWINVHI